MSLDLLKNAHNLIWANLEELLKQNRLPHALLFSGPYGIGKLEIAKELGASIIKSSAPAFTGADLHLLSPENASNTYSMDQIRAMLDTCQTTPYEGKHRVFILDQAERLGTQPSNAFLKLLEEPPPCHHFILVTSQAYKLLPTLNSRLQKCEFYPLDAELLKNYALKEGVELGEFGFLAQGSLGRVKLVSKYTPYLKAFVDLLPRSYKSEYASFRQFFDTLDEDESFDFLEFLPLFHELFRDYYHYLYGSPFAKLSWKISPKSSNLPSILTLSKSLNDIELSFSSNLKLSSCLDRFFTNLHVLSN